MDRKIIPLLIVLICSLCCLSLVSADTNTTDNSTVAEANEDLSSYIIPISLGENGISFSDGFTGFCIDSSKASISVNDHFTSQKTKNEDIENQIKLAIIEAYKAGEENNLGNIVSQVIAGNKEHDVVKSVFNSTEAIDDTAVVNISNNTEATFTFELLKSSDDSKSDCLAYKVSLKTIENKAVLGAGNDDSNKSAGNESANLTSNSKDVTNESNDSQETTNKTNDTTKAAGNDDNTDNNKSNEGQTIINETNNTLINKTNTVVVNENNTTIINQKNTKVINKTNETPQNKIMRTVGNPIFLLGIVIVIVAIVAVVMHRKN